MNYKTLTNKQLDDIFLGLSFKTKPRRHQLISLAFALDGRDRVCYLHDIGTGKTLTALYTAWLWNAGKILVVCPNSAIWVWEREIVKHTKFSYTILSGTSEERKFKLDEKKDIYIINYEGLKYIYCKRNGGFKVMDGYFTDKFDCLIMDEIHRLKTYTSIQSQICYLLSLKAKYVIALTGTPIGKNELDLWGEYRAIDLGVSLGTSFRAFRRTYFHPDWSGYNWKIKKNASEKILKRILPITMRFDRKECLDLPEKQYEKRIILPTKEQKQLMFGIIQQLTILMNGGKLSPQSALHKSLRLLQVAGGFIAVEKDGKYISERLSVNPKLEVLGECIFETREKIVVFHQFIEEGRIMEDWCSKNKVDFCSLRGEIKDKKSEYIRFKEGKAKVLIAHPAVGGESLDLTESPIMIFYSNGYSYLQRKQAEGRIHRLGQKQSCLFIDLVMKNSIDEIVSAKIAERGIISDDILAYLGKWR